MKRKWQSQKKLHKSLNQEKLVLEKKISKLESDVSNHKLVEENMKRWNNNEADHLRLTKKYLKDLLKNLLYIECMLVHFLY
mmetsp:Transcript_23435/g.34464  ORF Transcript_23435/g.34464 Transcript_23435/m.34464 type:complete len:81 (-) Transcript_23435:59-301(-)